MRGRHGKLLDDLKERRGYCDLKVEALDCTMWRARFGRDFGPVIQQATEGMNNFGLLPLFQECDSDINQGLGMCKILLGTYLINEGDI